LSVNEGGRHILTNLLMALDLVQAERSKALEIPPVVDIRSAFMAGR
jgi:hypothetical protein